VIENGTHCCYGLDRREFTLTAPPLSRSSLHVGVHAALKPAHARPNRSLQRTATIRFNRHRADRHGVVYAAKDRIKEVGRRYRGKSCTALRRICRSFSAPARPRTCRHGHAHPPRDMPSTRLELDAAPKSASPRSAAALPIDGRSIRSARRSYVQAPRRKEQRASAGLPPTTSPPLRPSRRRPRSQVPVRVHSPQRSSSPTRAILPLGPFESR